jgi:AcrR family transcriptional regulator
MLTPPRILRDQADRLTRRKYHFSAREQERETQILRVAEHLMAKNGRISITFASLAHALAITPATLRRHFSDLDALLADILQNHLLHLAKILGEANRTQPDQGALHRKAWYEATRTPAGALTDAHKLLVLHRHTLPQDLLDGIEAIYAGLGDILAPAFGTEVLALLDADTADLPIIEAFLVAPALLRAAKTEAAPAGLNPTAQNQAKTVKPSAPPGSQYSAAPPLWPGPGKAKKARPPPPCHRN